MEVNPWNVTSLEAFHFYNCPECDNKYSTSEQFVDHAMIVHEKAQATLPTILKNNLVISNVHSIQDKETEGCDDEDFELESSICIEKVEPMTDTELDENCDTSNLQPESDIERDINCVVLVKISKEEKTQADMKLKNRERIVKSEFQEKRKEYKRHKKYEMDPLTKRYKCNQCEKDYAQSCHLLEHFRIVHEGLTFGCKHCPKTFNSKGGLYLHMKNAHQGVTYHCKHCDKDFTQKRSMNRHVRSVHEGVTYQCEQCHKSCTQMSHLNQHVQTVHEGVTYPCEQCHKSFKQKSQLNQHVRLKHTNPK